jgi:7-carboxy-7-deazaguanine synthase
MTYALTEIFYTLQGEGYHAGTPALFIRFAGCSQWSGREEHRDRDAERNGSACPRFCDTDFIARERLELDSLIEAATEAAPSHFIERKFGVLSLAPLIVLTGGEPLLQLDAALVDGLRRRFPLAVLAIETNGAHALTVDVDWICVSPKLPADELKLRSGDELKIVAPAYRPEDYAAVSRGFTHRWVSAEAQPTGVGRSLIVAENLRSAAAWVMANPGWRLTVQTHKVIGIE